MTESKELPKLKKKKINITLNDIAVAAFIAVILVFFAIIDPTGVQALIQRDNVFIKTSTLPVQNSQVLGSKLSITELLAAKPNFQLKALKPQKPNVVPAGSSYLIFGDSMMQYGVGSAIENQLLAGNVSGVTREAIQSTGLLHTDRLNWYKRAAELADQSHPAVAVIMLGLNDLDGIYDENTGSYYQYVSDEWKLAYAQKVDQMINLLLNEKGIKKVFWVGLPVARKDFWNEGAKNVNEIYKSVSSRYINAVYVDTYERLSVNGQYSDIVTNDAGDSQFARQADGNHVNLFGGEIISNLVINSMKSHDVHF